MAPVLTATPVSPNYGYYEGIPMVWQATGGPMSVSSLVIEGAAAITADVIVTSQFSGSITVGATTIVSLLANSRLWPTQTRVDWIITLDDGVNPPVIEAGYFLSQPGVYLNITEEPQAVNSFYASSDPVELTIEQIQDDTLLREDSFTAAGGDETFTLAGTPAENPNTESGYAIYSVRRNICVNTYAHPLTDENEYDFTAPDQISLKGLLAGDIITILYASLE